MAVVESEGNGRMCLTLPRTMITLAGIEKVLPRFQDLEVMLQVLARSATGERMNPYTSMWTGVTPGDGPQKFHVVLLDNGRSSILAKKTERQTLQCIRCAACMNGCPVYRQTGGHAYGSVYPGPIGAILTPQLMQMQHAQSLPFASSLCGACYEVCPVKINIPEVLLDLRAQVIEPGAETGAASFFDPMYLGLRMANLIFSRAWLFTSAQWLGRIGLRLVYAQGWMDSLAAERGRQVDADAGPARIAEADVSRWWWDRRERKGTRKRDQGSKGTREQGNGGTMSARPMPQADSGAHSRGDAELRDDEPVLRRPREYNRARQLSGEARIALMIERLREYDAEVVECTAGGLPAAITAQLEASGKRTFVVPPEVPDAWLIEAAWKVTGFEWTIDQGLKASEIEQAEGVMTAAFCGVADSGTIVLHHSATEGRRVMTLLPDWHLCILRASQVVETLPEYFARCEKPPALVTWISGPSATADIEMTRIKGVHGPRFLNVIVVRDEETGSGE